MNTSEPVKQRSGRGGLASRLYQPLAAMALVAVMAVFLEGGSTPAPQEVVLPEQAMGGLSLPSTPSGTAVEAAHDTNVRALASYLSRRYRVAQDATEKLVGVAFDAGRQVGLDPLLILAVMAVESRLNPIAESETGAKGLMQIIPSYHKDKLDANAGTILDPMTNVLLGARILKDYIRRTGSLESGLQFYNGSLSDPEEQYAQQVMAVQQRLRQAIMGTRPGAKAARV